MLTLNEVEQLGTHGFFTREGFLGRALALRAHAEASLVPLRPAGVGRGRAVDPRVRSDALAWLTAEEATGAFVDVVQRFTAVMRALNEAAYLGLRSFDLQLARYAPGALYQRHRDAFPGDDNRRVTAIVYLNPSWQVGDGGELRIHLPEGAPGAPGTLDLAPTLDRLVVFRSALVEHEVLVARAERWAMTAWFSAR